MLPLRENGRPRRRHERPAESPGCGRRGRPGHDAEVRVHPGPVQRAHGVCLPLRHGHHEREHHEVCRRHETRAGRRHLLLHRQRGVLLQRQPVHQHGGRPRKVHLLRQGGPGRAPRHRVRAGRHPLPRLAGGTRSGLPPHAVPRQLGRPELQDHHHGPQPQVPGPA